MGEQSTWKSVIETAFLPAQAECGSSLLSFLLLTSRTRAAGRAQLLLGSLLTGSVLQERNKSTFAVANGKEVFNS